MNLKDKVVLITGASKGIGKAAAIALAKEGCSIIVNFKSDLKSAQAVMEECNQYSMGSITVKADVSDEESVVQLFKQIREHFSQVDILINNAGIFDESDGSINIRAFENVYKNNFLSCVIVTKSALKMMNQGKIINISSVHGRVGHGRPEAIAYSAFKAALESYTKNLAKEVAPAILVNAVAPGRVATPMWGDPNQDQQKKLGQVHLIKRMIQPEEVADSIVFLAKNDAMCGEVLTIDGGMSLVTLG